MLRCMLLCLALTGQLIISAQEKWDLQRCVDYAIKNNISVRQTDLQSRFSELALKQSRAAQIPSFSFGASGSNNFGLSDNPTTGILENNRFFSVGMQVQSQVTLFNWFARKNTVKANEITYEADRAQTEKIQNDIALNVAVAYLQVLLAREQINVSAITVEQTKAQLERTQKQVDAGTLPDLNAAQLEAQLALDSSSLITSQASAQQFLLQLKALLNLDAGLPFDIATPPLDAIPVEPIADLQPEAVYASAVVNLPQQKVNELRIQSAEKSVRSARGSMHPTISAFGSMDTRSVHFPSTSPFPSDKVLTQFRENFGQNIGLGLNIPIFNARNARTAWERAKLNVKNLELTKEQGDMQLKQDIYKAYTDAVAAIEKYNANKKGEQTAQKAYDYAMKRYDMGLLSTYELLNTQNSLQTARAQAIYARYDYVFKMKLLEFYKGQGLKL